MWQTKSMAVPTSMLRGPAREVILLQKHFPKYPVELDNGKIIVGVLEHGGYYVGNVVFDLSDDWPFKPPQISADGILISWRPVSLLKNNVLTPLYKMLAALLDSVEKMKPWGLEMNAVGFTGEDFSVWVKDVETSTKSAMKTGPASKARFSLAEISDALRVTRGIPEAAARLLLK